MSGSTANLLKNYSERIALQFEYFNRFLGSVEEEQILFILECKGTE